jgi:hypothetical protein
MEEDRLLVVQSPPAHGRIARLLAELEARAGRLIVVEGTLALVQDDLLSSWGAGAAESIELPEAAVRSLDKALRSGDRATRIASLRAVARDGQCAGGQALTNHVYLGGYDAESDLGPNPYKSPSMSCFMRGISFEVRPLLARERVVCRIRFTHSDGPIPVPTFDMKVPLWAPIGLPAQDVTAWETTVVGRNGRTILAGRVAVRDPRIGSIGAPAGASTAQNRSFCLFVRPTIVSRPAASPAPPDGGHILRAFDVGPLIESPQDAGSSSFGLRHGYSIWSLDDVPCRLSVPQLIEEIRSQVLRGGENGDADAIVGGHDALFARHEPAVLDRIGRYLDARVARGTRAIRARVDLVAAEEAAYAKLADRYGSFRSGTPRLSAAELSEILDKGARGEDGLERVASGEIVGLNRQRVALRRAFSLSCVLGYDVDSAPHLIVRSPQIDCARDGFMMECRMMRGSDDRTIRADLAIRWARLDRPIAVEQANATGALLHLPVLEQVPFVATVIAAPGEPALAGVAGPVTVGTKAVYLIPIARFFPLAE